MTARGSDRVGSGGDHIPAAYSWLGNALRLVCVPVLALLWWALAFLPWTRARLPGTFGYWPPSLPARLSELDVAVFGPIGASLVVIALIRRADMALFSILLGLAVPAWVTLTRGADLHGNVLNSNERSVMLALCAFAAFGGLAVGTVAIRSLPAFGFFGLLAVQPVTELVALLLPADSDLDPRWLIRAALVMLLMMNTRRRRFGVPWWPAFFLAFWLLSLLMSALAFGAQTLRRPGSTDATVWRVAEAMLEHVRSAWLVSLGTSWSVFWPAAVITALVIAGLYASRRLRAAGIVPER